jgi:hypothetical protein
MAVSIQNEPLLLGPHTCSNAEYYLAVSNDV